MHLIFQVKWWDIRKFTEPVEVLVLDPSKQGSNNTAATTGDVAGTVNEIRHGASCLEYEPTIPTKFMVGTDRGNF